MSNGDVPKTIEPSASMVSKKSVMESDSFPRSARLLTGKDYSQVFGKSKRLSGRYWTVLVRKHSSNTSRLGLAIAKKRAKRAVDRNAMKRVAREAFRQKRRRLVGCDLVVMNRDGAASVEKHLLSQELNSLFQRIDHR